MYEEAFPIIKYFNLLQVNSSTIKMFTGIDKRMFGPSFNKICDKLPIYMSGSGNDVVLIITGVGKVNASIAASYALSIINPSEVVNIGMCGSLKPELHKQGQIVSIKEVFQHGVYIPLKGIQFEYLMDKIDLELPINKRISNDEIEFNEVVLATGDSFIDDIRTLLELSKKADVVDMEGYSFARVCQIYSVKLKIYKMISDSSNSEACDDFKKSLEIYDEKINNLLNRI
jgi:adenosylhomocysteine nucleosidase